LSDAEKAKALQIAPGDVKWKDINNDGTIDAFDQVVMGNTTPHWVWWFQYYIDLERTEHCMDVLTLHWTIGFMIIRLPGSWDVCRVDIIQQPMYSILGAKKILTLNIRDMFGPIN